MKIIKKQKLNGLELKLETVTNDLLDVSMKLNDSLLRNDKFIEDIKKLKSENRKLKKALNEKGKKNECKGVKKV